MLVHTYAHTFEFNGQRSMHVHGATAVRYAASYTFTGNMTWNLMIDPSSKQSLFGDNPRTVYEFQIYLHTHSTFLRLHAPSLYVCACVHTRACV